MSRARPAPSRSCVARRRGRRGLGGGRPRPARAGRPGVRARQALRRPRATCWPRPAPAWPRSPWSSPGSPVSTPTASTRSAAAGLGVVLVADSGRAGDGEAERLRRLGVEHVLSRAELDGLADGALTTAGAAAAPAGTRRGAPPGRRPDAPPPGTRGRRLGSGRRPGSHHRRGRPGRRARPSRATTAFLLDADPYGGAVAQHLGVLDEVSGLLAAARAANAGRLDADRLCGFARQVGEQLCGCSPGCPAPTGGPRSGRRAFEDLLERRPRLASYRRPRRRLQPGGRAGRPVRARRPHRNQMTLAPCSAADEVVVVGAADPVGLSRLARGLVELRDLRARRAAAGGGQPDPPVARLERARDPRHGRGLRDARSTCTSCPTTGSPPTGR